MKLTKIATIEVNDPEYFDVYLRYMNVMGLVLKKEDENPYKGCPVVSIWKEIPGKEWWQE